MHDITDQKQAEAARVRAERLLKNSGAKSKQLLSKQVKLSQNLQSHTIQTLYSVGIKRHDWEKYNLQRSDGAHAHSVFSEATDQINQVIRKLRMCLVSEARSKSKTPALVKEQIIELLTQANSSDQIEVETVLEVEAIKIANHDEVETVLAIVRGGLGNISRHAKASHATVSLRCSLMVISPQVTDDGMGGAPERRRKYKGHGLHNMQARA